LETENPIWSPEIKEENTLNRLNGFENGKTQLFNSGRVVEPIKNKSGVFL